MSDSQSELASLKTIAMVAAVVVLTVALAYAVATTSPVLTTILVVLWTATVMGWAMWMTRKVLRLSAADQRLREEQLAADQRLREKQMEGARQHREHLALMQLEILRWEMRTWLDERGRQAETVEKALSNAQGERPRGVTPIRRAASR